MIRRLSNWSIVGLILLVSFLIYATAGRELNPSPSSENPDPKGFQLFANLLQENGFQVRRDRSAVPTIKPDEVAIVFLEFGRSNFIEEIQREVDDDRRSERQDFPPRRLDREMERIADPFILSLDEHMKRKGTVLAFYVTQDNVDEITRPVQFEFARGGKSRYRINAAFPRDLITPLPSIRPDPFVLAGDNANDAVTVSLARAGLFVELLTASSASNEWLPRHDNAQFALDVLNRTAPGRKVVFLEASAGNATQSGLFLTIGPWAEALRWQMFALLAVIFFAKGALFGPPITDRVPVRGARALVDAIAGIMSRNSGGDLMRHSTLADVTRRVAKRNRMPLDSTFEAVKPYMTPSLVEAYLAVRDSDFKPREVKNWIVLFQTLEDEIRDYESGTQDVLLK